MKILGVIREFSSIIFNRPSGTDIELKPASKTADGAAEKVINIPDGNDDTDSVVLVNEAQTLDNKTFDGFIALLDTDDSHAYSINSGALTANVNINLPDAPTNNDDFVLTTTAQTVQNKTLRDTTLSNGTAAYPLSISGAGSETLTIPDMTANDTFVFEAHTQTLTNKTITAGSNTISGLTNANLAATGVANIALNKLAATTNNVALKTDASGFIIPSAVTDTELEYLDGVTSAIQPQINGKAGTALDNLTLASLAAEDLLIGASSSSVTRLGVGLNGQVLTISGGAVTWDNPVGTGDVVGPGSSTDNAITRYDLTTGKVLQNSAVTLSDNASIDGIAITTHISEPTVDFTITTGNTGFHPQMDIGSGRTLTIDSGAQFSTIAQLTNDGTLVNNGSIYIG